MNTTLKFLFLFFVGISTYAQLGHSFDIGVNIGAVSLQGDYGERGDIKSGLTGNIGFGTSISLYKNFYDNDKLKWNSRTQLINDYIKLKATISYHTIQLNHFGEYVENSERLQAMTGTSSVLNFGGGVEFHLLSLAGFSGFSGQRLLSPYVNLGGMVGISNATVSSSIGNYEEDITVLIPAYQQNAIYTDQHNIGSFIFGGGTRVKIGNYTELNIETQWQIYFSDKIDGLKPRLDANKYNDWAYSLSVGLVYEL